ncbi:MAG: protein translocase subunit SecF [Formosimonas sp.]
MEFFRFKKDINFMKHALILNAVSFITFLLAVFFLYTKGLHYSIEFTGGTTTVVQYDKAANVDQVRAVVEKLGYADAQVQEFDKPTNISVRLPVKQGVASGAQTDELLAALKAQDASASLLKSDFVGPQIGDELALSGGKALLFVVIGIVIYLAMRFEWKFAVAGILANLHDVVIILGFFAFFQWEFSLSVLAAILAILGYSVNESVVIFDRIREVFRDPNSRPLTVPQVMNHAITSTTSRTIITHACTELVVLAMLFFGGPTLHYFALALTIGIVFGIYSSVFVAAALAMWFGVSRSDLALSEEDLAKAKMDKRDPSYGAQV